MIGLGNSSDQPVHANLILSTGDSQTVDVAPFGTEIVRLRSNTLGPASTDRVEAVSINYTGPEGSLIPTGYTASDNGKFASMIRFYDTQHVVQQNLFANNLRLKDATPHMVLQNVSADFITASPMFLPPSGDSNQAIKLGAVRLAPSETTEVKLSPLLEAASNRSDLDSVSVQVTNSGGVGSLIGALYSINDQTGVTYDVPLRDSGPPRASTGGYPIRLDGDYTTVITITNTTDKPGDFTMQINYDGGPYVIGMILIAPGATKTFDIRKIRDDQKPDVNGHPLPRGLQVAQAKWSIRHNVRLNGRSEVVSLKDGVSSSYSCSLCCPNSFGGAHLDPQDPTIWTGDTQTLTIMEMDQNGYYCGGNTGWFPYYGGDQYWWSEDDYTASVYYGEVTGQNPGTTTINVEITACTWTWDDIDESCSEDESPTDTYTNINVADFSISGAQTVKDGDSASFSVSVSNATASSYSWSFTSPSGAGNAPNVTFSAQSSQSTNTDAHWFANPDRDCPVTSFDATYTIKCRVTLSNGKHKDKQTSLTVNAYWNPAGDTAAPVISGGPTIGFDTSQNLWVVVNSGTLARSAPTITVYVPSASQFYYKAAEHENRHSYQWTSGLLSDLLLISDLMTQLSPLTDATQSGLTTKINNAAQSWYNNQASIANSRHNAAERDAYSVSDPIAPQYLYQNCGRY